jgi:geranylgeranyl diphosphate synthase type I
MKQPTRRSVEQPTRRSIEQPTRPSIEQPGALHSLATTRALVEPAIEAALMRLSPELRRVASYHFGFADADGHRIESRGGKAVRPALALLSAEAGGLPPEDGVPGAVSVELIHNFSLLHDDVMDQDRERRHRPTVWALFGVGTAIIVGDALQTLAEQVLLEQPGPEPVLAARSLADATARMITGQAQDLAFESQVDVTFQDCIAMEAGKTGALLSCASSIGAILAGAEQPVVESLAAFGLHLGLAFQAIDDILGIWGRPEVTGKPVASDLRQNKKSLPIVAALDSGTAAGRRLSDLLSNGPLSDEAVAQAVLLIEEAGGRDRAVQEADRNVARADQALERAGLPHHVHDRFAELAGFVTARDF